MPNVTPIFTDSLANFDRVGDANWRVAERTLTADKGNGFLVTKQPYGDFRLRAEVWVDEAVHAELLAAEGCLGN